MKSKIRFIFVHLLAVLLMVIFPCLLYSQSQITIPHTSQSIVFDGMPDEQVWELAEPFPLTTYYPEDGLQPTENSDVRMVYDDQYLYIGARLYDSDPSGIQTTGYQRNFEDLSSDMFGIILDTFNNNETGFAFFTNPGAARSDFMISNDAEGGDAFNYDWNTFWDVETIQNENGWFVEMRIPLSSLRFQQRDGQVTMGLTVMRWIARKNESNVFPAIPDNWGFDGQYKPSQTQAIIFDQLEYTRPLHITPYVMGGFSQQHYLSENPEDSEGYLRDDEFTYDAGVDVKYGLSSNLTLDLTVNTDFVQAEADDEQVNLTRFALFLPEKRQFFQERSDLFDVSMGGSNRLFYSRRIGIQDGRQIRILGGARLTGSIGNWDVGLLNMQTARAAGVPSENFGAFRLRRNVLNPNSFVGTMFSSRLDEDGNYNYAFGFDGTVNMFGDDYVTFHYGQVVDSELDQPIFGMDTSRMVFDWETRRNIGWGYNLGISRNGVLFMPGAGFAGRLNYTRFGPGLNYGWRGRENSRFQNHQVSIGGNVFLFDNTGELESINMGPEWTTNWKSGSRFSAELIYNYENLVETFWITNDVPIPADTYNFTALELNFNTPEGGLYSAETEVSIGQFFDGYRYSGEISSRLSISPRFNLQPYYEINHIEFSIRDQKFTTHVGRVRAEFYLNREVSLRTFVQYSNESDLVLSNIRFRYNPREGTDLYILYNENIQTNRDAYRPVPPVSQARSFLVKFNYTF